MIVPTLLLVKNTILSEKVGGIDYVMATIGENERNKGLEI